MIISRMKNSLGFASSAIPEVKNTKTGVSVNYASSSDNANSFVTSLSLGIYVKFAA